MAANARPTRRAKGSLYLPPPKESRLRLEADNREQHLVLDRDFGYDFIEGAPRRGWLVNMVPITAKVDSLDRSALELFFIDNAGARFKACILYEPYFYVLTSDVSQVKEVKGALERKFEKELSRCDEVLLDDLNMSNHLSGLKRLCVKLSFRNQNDMSAVRKQLMPIASRNKAGQRTSDAYSTGTNGAGFFGGGYRSAAMDKSAAVHSHYQQQQQRRGVEQQFASIVELREHDVTYYQRVCIDLEIFAGSWYEVKPDATQGALVSKLEIFEKAQPVVLAFDIECTKQPLKFPDAKIDQIFMISYMVDGEGYLIVNREFVSADVSDFEFNPKPEFPGPFSVLNVKDETELISAFFTHVRQVRPNIFVTYNGDFFDWPFLEQRAKERGMDMEKEIGIGMVMPPQAFSAASSTAASATAAAAAAKQPNAGESSDSDGDDGDDDDAPRGGEYRGRNAVHIDCLYWVKRDSYLPAGSRGLKAVTKAKLGYDPIEIDAEDMERQARERPEHMASYSVSDAVSTYYLYDKYIHLFIFSLCTIIPMGPEDVLRKGSGTLCESLLMVEAFKKKIICPNKQNEVAEKFYNDHLLEAETYVGGHVESLESGVFRSDLPCSFALDPTAFAELEAKVDRDLAFAIEVELGMKVEECVNLDTVKQQIISSLGNLMEEPKRIECPTIYHLDVGAMYPNIILTNRLQPIAIVDQVTCAACVHNRGPESDCKRKMPWEWRGDMFPATRSEYRQILAQLETENIDGVMFRDLSMPERKRITRQRLKEYSSKTYKRVKDTITEEREATVCMRENPFYVDTIRAFRDRRNEYKGHAKKWNAAKKKATDPVDKAEADTKVLLYDSLQLAHKCILNSFYGYVMRRGARWHSMEMAAIVTRTGADLIKQARRLVERVGKPLELDTDGIWCVLPKSFPGNFSLEFANSDKRTITYPCVMLNADVHANFTNHQYQDAVPGSTNKFTVRSECSIFFELDGPYKCMVLPASQEEGKLLKKRYAVFNDNGTLAELKGFEMKRRGELKIIKAFQAQVFERFLRGSTLEECYQSVAEIADFWLDVLYSKGASLTDEEVIDLISENRSMSRSLADYGEQKSTAITTAKRLAEFLGNRMTRDKGLACQLFIASRPVGSPTTERAIPTAIFSSATDPAVRDACLRRWLKEPSLPSNPDVRSIIDWEYYQDRLGKAVQKIITIPAALQRVDNPVPRVKHPVWLARLVREKHDPFKQVKLENFFSAARPEPAEDEEEPEEQGKEAALDEDAASQKDMIDLTGDKKTLQRRNRVALRPGSHEWLRARKVFWRQIRQSKRNRGGLRSAAGFKSGAKTDDNKIARPNGDLMSFAKELREAEEGDVLHVIEFRPLPEEPGVFVMFAVGSSGVLQTKRVVVPRIVYLDSINPLEEESTMPPNGVSRRRVTGMHLPHAQASKGLFALEMDEAFFRSRPKELADFLSRSEVAGVYETQVPLSMRVMVQLGNTVRITANVPSASWDDDLPLASLSMAELPSNARYLEGDHRRVLIFHAGKKDRQIVAMFLVHDGELHKHPRSASATVWLSGGAADDHVNLERLLRSELKSHNMDEDACTFAEPPQVLTVAGNDSCWRALQSDLSEIVATRTRGSVIVLAQCGLAKADLLSCVSCLNDVPVVELASDSFEFPALQWRRLACKRALGAFLRHSSWFQNHLDGARFAKMPVAMIGHDWALSLSDLLFARNLAHNKMVLWASPSGSPDLGGNEQAVDLEVLLGDVESPVITSPGAYRTVCAQIKIEHLAMTAVLEADLVNELDFGGDGALQGQGIGVAGECARAFRVLKGMMSLWYEAAVGANNVFADALLVSVYRWLASSKSLFHDPSLHRHVHSLMKKLFLQLLALIRKLGGGIIMANFVNMTIDTGKLDVITGQAFIEHFRDTAQSRDPFRYLSFAPLRYWSVFLFMDVCNYGGRVVIDNGEETMQEWNLSRFLPGKWVNHFDKITTAFLAVPSKTRDEVIKAYEGRSGAKRAIEDEDEDETLEQRIKRAGDKSLQEFVADKLTPFLIKLLGMEKDAVGSDWFPELPGSHRQLRHPALEFTKSLCAVLELDSAVADKVLGLKRSLLKQLRIAEFSPDAEFRNPSLSLVLPDIVCGGCGTCEDLDLCRDPRLFKGDDVEFQWQCYRCQHAIDRDLVESSLVDLLHHRLLAYQVQDLVCVKCRAVRADSTSDACACSGTWTLLHTPAAFKHSVAPFAAVAKYYEMTWLNEVVETIA